MTKPTPQPLDGEDLPELTDKQMAFVEAILAGAGVAEAYRASRDTSGMNDRSIAVNASREHYNPNIQKWLRAARMAKLGKIVSTKDDHEAELVRAREFAYQLGDPKAVVAAETSRGKLNGHYVERHEHTVIDPAALLAEIRAMNPKVAAALAEQFNVPLIDLNPAKPHNPSD